MAITIDGIPVSGSIGLDTFSRNRFGAYTRRRTKPVNPNTVGQQNARSSFRTAVIAWINTLTPIERSAWETYAAGVPWLNKAGESVRMTGQNAWIRVASFFIQRNSTLPPTLLPPPTFDIGSMNAFLNSLTYDVSANTLTASLEAPVPFNSWQVEDSIVVGFVSQPANPSTNFRPNRFTQAGAATIGAVPADTVNMGAATSPYVYQAGQSVWYKVRAIDPENRLTAEQLIGPITITVVP